MNLRIAAIAFLVAGCATSGVQRRSTAIEDADREAKRAVEMETQLDASSIPARSLTILPFTVTTSDTLLRPLGFALSDFVAADLSQSPQVQMLERQRVGAMLRELKMVDEGLTDPQGAPRVGRLVGARRIIIGNLSTGPAGDLVVTARVVDVNAGEVRTAVSATAPLTRFVDAQKALSLLLFADLGITLTPAQRARVEQRQTSSLAAAVSYGRGVNADMRGDAAGAVAAFEEASRLDVAFAAARAQASGATQARGGSTSGGLARVLALSVQAVNPVSVARVPDVAEAAVQANQVFTLLLTIRVF
jgi:hypothetical protein